ncbi:MAG: NAD(P)H-hydrate dehydratase [Ignavibacteria bacterium]|jgi:NAD(P)H-hydrate epimerase
MKSVFTFDEIRQLEKQIIETEKVPSIVLMENAGKNFARVLMTGFPGIADYEIYVICGKGNNAGDGFTLARHFVVNNIPVKVVLLADPSSLKGDALINYDILNRLISENDNMLKFVEYPNFVSFVSRLNRKSKLIIIDAILGTGIKGKLDEKFSSVIESLNRMKAKHPDIKIISVDVPSGITGEPDLNPVVKADMTISMGTCKSELLFDEGKENSGRLVIVPIGVTDNFLDEHNSFKKHYVELPDVKELFPRRKKSSYKYVNGKVLIIGGSRGLSGAVAMSATSALRSGAGGVVAAIPKGISNVFNRKLYEVMTVELEETDEGTIKSGQWDKLKKRVDWADTVLLGPGISTNADTGGFVLDVIRNCSKNMVLDADGLTLLANDISVLKNRKFKNQIILTPHLGEFSRLTNVEIKAIRSMRYDLVRHFADEFNVNIALKSETTFSCLTNGEVYINSSGNETLAVAGSGDLLSGIITSIFSQTKDAYAALVCGNYLHGLCADMYAQKSGNKQSASPQDIMSLIPKAVTYILS